MFSPTIHPPAGPAPTTAINRAPSNYKWTLITFSIVISHCLLIIAMQIVIIVIFSGQALGSSKDSPIDRMNATAQINYIAVNITYNDLTEQSKKIVVYHFIFISAQLFLLLTWWNTLFRKNVMQVFFLLLFEYLCVGYSFLNGMVLAIHSRTLNNNEVIYWIDASITGMSMCGALVLTALSFKLYRNMGWHNFKRLGADIRFKRMFVSHQIMMTLLKFDMFFFPILSVQCVTLVIDQNNTVHWSSLAVWVLSCILAISLAYYGTLYEKRWALVVFIASLPIAFMSLIYLVISMIQTMGREDDPYHYSRTVILVFTVINMVLVALSVVYSVVCYCNIGKGLLALRLNSRNSPKLVQAETGRDRKESDASLSVPGRTMGIDWQRISKVFDMGESQSVYASRFEID